MYSQQGWQQQQNSWNSLPPQERARYDMQTQNQMSQPYGDASGHFDRGGPMGAGMGANPWSPYNSIGLPQHNPFANMQQNLMQGGFGQQQQLMQLLGNYAQNGSWGTPSAPIYDYSRAGYQPPMNVQPK